jgi:hypothetical protein
VSGRASFRWPILGRCRMPRELYLITPSPVSIESLVAAAAVVDDQLGVRALYGGAALQLVDDADVAVLTIENSRLLADAVDAAALTSGLDLADRGEVWWTEAVVPWGSDGEAGVHIAAGIARVLAGQLRVEDGT